MDHTAAELRVNAPTDVAGRSTGIDQTRSTNQFAHEAKTVIEPNASNPGALVQQSSGGAGVGCGSVSQPRRDSMSNLFNPSPRANPLMNDGVVVSNPPAANGMVSFRSSDALTLTASLVIGATPTMSTLDPLSLIVQYAGLDSSTTCSAKKPKPKAEQQGDSADVSAAVQDTTNADNPATGEPSSRLLVESKETSKPTKRETSIRASGMTETEHRASNRDSTMSPLMLGLPGIPQSGVPLTGTCSHKFEGLRNGDQSKDSTTPLKEGDSVHALVGSHERVKNDPANGLASNKDNQSQNQPNPLAERPKVLRLRVWNNPAAVQVSTPQSSKPTPAKLSIDTSRSSRCGDLTPCLSHDEEKGLATPRWRIAAEAAKALLLKYPAFGLTTPKYAQHPGVWQPTSRSKYSLLADASVRNAPVEYDRKVFQTPDEELAAITQARVGRIPEIGPMSRGGLGIHSRPPGHFTNYGDFCDDDDPIMYSAWPDEGNHRFSVNGYLLEHPNSFEYRLNLTSGRLFSKLEWDPSATTPENENAIDDGKPRNDTRRHSWFGECEGPKDEEMHKKRELNAPKTKESKIYSVNRSLMLLREARRRHPVNAWDLILPMPVPRPSQSHPANSLQTSSSKSVSFEAANKFPGLASSLAAEPWVQRARCSGWMGTPLHAYLDETESTRMCATEVTGDVSQGSFQMHPETRLESYLLGARGISRAIEDEKQNPTSRVGVMAFRRALELLTPNRAGHEQYAPTYDASPYSTPSLMKDHDRKRGIPPTPKTPPSTPYFDAREKDESKLEQWRLCNVFGQGGVLAEPPHRNASSTNRLPAVRSYRNMTTPSNTPSGVAESKRLDLSLIQSQPEATLTTPSGTLHVSINFQVTQRSDAEAKTIMPRVYEDCSTISDPLEATQDVGTDGGNLHPTKVTPEMTGSCASKHSSQVPLLGKSLHIECEGNAFFSPNNMADCHDEGQDEFRPLPNLPPPREDDATRAEGHRLAKHGYLQSDLFRGLTFQRSGPAPDVWQCARILDHKSLEAFSAIRVASGVDGPDIGDADAWQAFQLRRARRAGILTGSGLRDRMGLSLEVKDSGGNSSGALPEAETIRRFVKAFHLPSAEHGDGDGLDSGDSEMTGPSSPQRALEAAEKRVDPLLWSGLPSRLIVRPIYALDDTLLPSSTPQTRSRKPFARSSETAHMLTPSGVLVDSEVENGDIEEGPSSNGDASSSTPCQIRPRANFAACSEGGRQYARMQRRLSSLSTQVKGSSREGTDTPSAYTTRRESSGPQEEQDAISTERRQERKPQPAMVLKGALSKRHLTRAQGRQVEQSRTDMEMTPSSDDEATATDTKRDDDLDEVAGTGISSTLHGSKGQDHFFRLQRRSDAVDNRYTALETDSSSPNGSSSSATLCPDSSPCSKLVGSSATSAAIPEEGHISQSVPGHVSAISANPEDTPVRIHFTGLTSCVKLRGLGSGQKRNHNTGMLAGATARRGLSMLVGAYDQARDPGTTVELGPANCPETLQHASIRETSLDGRSLPELKQVEREPLSDILNAAPFATGGPSDNSLQSLESMTRPSLTEGYRSISSFAVYSRQGDAVVPGSIALNPGGGNQEHDCDEGGAGLESTSLRFSFRSLTGVDDGRDYFALAPSGAAELGIPSIVVASQNLTSMGNSSSIPVHGSIVPIEPGRRSMNELNHSQCPQDGRQSPPEPPSLTQSSSLQGIARVPQPIARIQGSYSTPSRDHAVEGRESPGESETRDQRSSRPPSDVFLRRLRAAEGTTVPETTLFSPPANFRHRE